MICKKKKNKNSNFLERCEGQPENEVRKNIIKNILSATENEVETKYNSFYCISTSHVVPLIVENENTSTSPPPPTPPEENTRRNYEGRTIDEKHTEMLCFFDEIDNVIVPFLSNEITKLKILLNKNKKKCVYSRENQVLKNNVKHIDNILEIKEKIKQLKKKIKIFKTKKKKYLMENSKYIFQYFEDKKKISFGENNKNVNKLNAFFKIKNDEIESFSDSKNNKKNYQDYWKNVKNEIPNIQNFIVSTDICQSCHNGELIPHEEEGILICNNMKCGKFITCIIDNSKPTNKEPPNEVSYTAYIRLNHFKEILSQFQAKETTQIPDDVIQLIKNRIKKERIQDIKTIDYDKMREILRKLSLNKYFEHIQYINSIIGIKPPIMNEELYETLCFLFIEIQNPWSIHCPPYRTNFFNYAYTLYQLCVLLGQTQYLPYIPLLKDRTKQLEQDMVWEKVCKELGWLYIPSI